MRPIDNRNLRTTVNLNDLEALNIAITQVAAEKRKDFIDEKESECSKIRTGLWEIGDHKCWYSEALLQECEGQVEHFRPKKRLSGIGHEGYWWRAFDWTNLRLAHPTVNRRKTDYLTGIKSGKGSYFPLLDEAKRANNPGEETNEQPVLLDPLVLSDTRLLAFSEESGATCPRYDKEKNEWDNRRAGQSIDYYHLNEATWNAKRADLMSIVKKLCEQLEEIKIKQPFIKAEYDQKINEIFNYISPSAEFSSACRQVVRERGLMENDITGL